LVLKYISFEDLLAVLLMSISICGAMALLIGNERRGFGRLKRRINGLRFYLKGRRVLPRNLPPQKLFDLIEI
jgi:hypothetical protein